MEARLCTVDGCQSRRYAKGLCNRHYLRQRKHGDPTVTLLRRPDPDADPTYGATHKRLTAERGSAAGQLCADCGGEAVCWAYNRSGEGERSEVRNGWVVTYSIDLAQYDPCCRSCNVNRDKPARPTHCKRGHEFTPENTRTRANGTRNCRACAKETV